MGLHYNYSGGDGRTAQSAAPSARAIKAHFPGSFDGLYWLVNPTINDGEPFQVYCDMTTNGGGWILLVQNASIGGATKMNYTNYSLHNELAPPNASLRATVDKSYSILAWADALKNPSRPFEYMIDAYDRQMWGGIWRANDPTYTFNQTVNTATDITLTQQFGSWYYNNGSIEERMPYLTPAATDNGMLTTSTYPDSTWWGTIIEAASLFSPAPWVSSGGTTESMNPGVIWYWMRGL